MQYCWLKKSEKLNNDKTIRKLIIFFCGWSFDNKPFEPLDCGEYDVLMFYDYKNHTIPFDIPDYDEYYLITWSMGVYIAYLLRDKLPEFKLKIAVNGTPFPIHNHFGIPERTFDLTLKYVDTGLQGKFQRNLFKKDDDFEKYMLNPVARKIPEQAEELRALKDFISMSELSYDNFYDRAIIGESDKIIPAQNQINFWKEHAPLVLLDSGHFPFYGFKSWNEILQCK